MDDAAVVPRLMRSGRAFFLKHSNTTIGKPVHGFQRASQPNNAATDDDEIKLQVYRIYPLPLGEGAKREPDRAKPKEQGEGLTICRDLRPSPGAPASLEAAP